MPDHAVILDILRGGLFMAVYLTVLYLVPWRY